MFKVAIRQEYKIIKTYIQDITEPQNIRHTLMKFKDNIKSFTILIGDSSGQTS